MSGGTLTVIQLKNYISSLNEKGVMEIAIKVINKRFKISRRLQLII